MTIKYQIVTASSDGDETKYWSVDEQSTVNFSPELRKDFKYKEFDGESSSKIIGVISGYASTVTLDRQDEIIESSAFESSIEQFMEFPVVHLNHDFGGFSSGAPFGKVIDYRIDSFGLWVEIALVDTPKGREVFALIEAEILKAFSIGFRIKERIVNTDDDIPTRITDLELIEISIVSSPANTDSLILEAEAKGIEIKSLTITPNANEGKTKGVFNVITKKDVDSAITTSLEPLGAKFEATDTTVGELGNKVDALNVLISNFKDTAKSGDKTADELKTLVVKTSGEFTARLDELSKEVNIAKSKKPIGLGATTPILNSKDVLSRTNEELKQVLGDADARKAIELKRLNDDLLFLDAMMECGSRNNQGRYHHTSKAERIKELKYFGRFDAFLKGYDLTEDVDWVPTDMSSNLEEIYRLERRVASLFAEFTMPSGAGSFDWPIQSSDSVAKLIGETTAIQTNQFDALSEHPTTDKVTFTAKKARARIQLSAEFTEDSAIAVLQWAQRQAGMSIVNAVESALINGDDNGSHRDSNVSSPNFDEAWDGLRFHANAKSTEIDTVNVALTPAFLRSARAGMNKYGVHPGELAFIISPKTYLFSILANSAFSDLQTLDKYGPGATILTGEVLRFDGVPVIVSEYQWDNLDDGGEYDGVTTDKAAAILVHRPTWMIGNKRAINVAVERSIPHDMWTIFAFKRLSFQTFWTGTGENNVAAIINYLTI